MLLEYSYEEFTDKLGFRQSNTIREQAALVPNLKKSGFRKKYLLFFKICSFFVEGMMFVRKKFNTNKKLAHMERAVWDCRVRIMLLHSHLATIHVRKQNTEQHSISNSISTMFGIWVLIFILTFRNNTIVR